MKVLALVVLAIGSAAALGSGPYLPSGWKPDGPAFYLPSEVQKPAIPLKDAPIQEAGSDFLREYGPPKTVQASEDLTLQALPDVATEQTFSVIQAKLIAEEVKQVEAATEAIADLNVIVQEETTASVTESQVTVEEQTVEAESEPAQAKLIIVDEISQATQEESAENTVEVTQKETIEVTQNENTAVTQQKTESNIVAVEERVSAEINGEVRAIEEVVKEVESVGVEVTGEVKAVEEGVKNIAEALVNLENEIRAEQIQTIQELTEVRTKVQENSGALAQVPEGFLEYGPPGFREYGPPKGDGLLRSAAVIEVNAPLAELIDSNETRKRRFSPKFKQTARRLH